MRYEICTLGVIGEEVRKVIIQVNGLDLWVMDNYYNTIRITITISWLR